MRALGFLVLSLGLYVASSEAATGDFDGSKPLLCDTEDLIECTVDKGCVASDTDSLAIVSIDFAKREVRSYEGSGEPRTSKIENMRHNNGEFILQGVEGGLGWSLLITEATGDMVVTASGEGGAFILFGACAPL